MMQMPVVIRGFAGGRKIFEELMEDDGGLDLEKLAKRHVAVMEPYGKKYMIELEFLEEADPGERFFRVGTDPEAMVMPIAIDPYSGPSSP